MPAFVCLFGGTHACSDVAEAKWNGTILSNLLEIVVVVYYKY